MVAGIGRLNTDQVLDDLDARNLQEAIEVSKMQEATIEKMEKVIAELQAKFEGAQAQVHLEWASKQQMHENHTAQVGTLNAQLEIQKNTIAELQKQIEGMRTAHANQMAAIRNEVSICPNFDDPIWNMDKDPILATMAWRRGQLKVSKQNIMNLASQNI